ncbi:MAG TPA: AMP-binding protein, partial [Stellaceae bacterium]
MNIHDKSRYHEVHARSLADPEGFWAEAAREIDWIEPAKKIFDPSSGAYGRWFTGAVVNTCYNALDRHVAGGRANQVALIHDSSLNNNTVTKFTYAELLSEVQTLAAVMADFGLTKGDRVILYMPMVAEAVVAMLACARIGAVHSVVFGGFAAKELATRIDDAKPKLVFSASCGLEPGRIVHYKPLLDEAIKLASAKPSTCIILQRPQHGCDLIAGRDHDWADLRRAALKAGKSAPCVPVLATDPLYILYTSGTTGVPKG